MPAEVRAHRPKSKTTTFSSSSMMYVSTELGPALCSRICGIQPMNHAVLPPRAIGGPRGTNPTRRTATDHHACGVIGIGPTQTAAHAYCGFRYPRFGGARSDQPSACKARYITWHFRATCNNMQHEARAMKHGSCGARSARRSTCEQLGLATVTHSRGGGGETASDDRGTSHQRDRCQRTGDPSQGLPA